MFSRLSRLVQGALKIQQISEATLQSIGEQAYARTQVAQRVQRGEKPAYEYEGGGSVVFPGGDRYGCGFLNLNDATDFFAKLDLLNYQGYSLAEVKPYSSHPDNYDFKGWVKTAYPPRCNTYYKGPNAFVIDLGAVEAKF